MTRPVQLPFYPDTHYQFAWNSSALGALKTCARYYQYRYIIGWQPRGSGLHIRFGSLYHAALEQYDRLCLSGANSDDALATVVHDLLHATWDNRLDDGTGGAPWDTGDTKKNRETLVRSVIWYVEHYNPDPAKTLVLTDGTPALELEFKVELPFDTITGEPYLYTGHIDRMVEYGEDKFVTDRKTTGSTISSYYFDKFNPDNQMSGYIFAARIMFDVPVAGVIIDAAQIAVGFTTFQRGITARSEGQLQEWLVDCQTYFEAANRYADAEYYPMNDKACHMCEFRRVCQADPAMRDNFLRTDFEIDMYSVERILG